MKKLRIRLSQKEAKFIYDELEFFEYKSEVNDREKLKELKEIINPIYKDNETKAEWTYWGKHGYKYKTDITLKPKQVKYLVKILKKGIEFRSKYEPFVPFNPDLSHLKEKEKQYKELREQNNTAYEIINKIKDYLELYEIRT